MARPEKRGLEYFPLDVDFMRDIKVRRINRKHGALGVIVIIELYSRIYHKNGYYLRWDEDTCFDIFEELNNENPEQIQAIVDSCLQVGLFHAELYETQHVLTSNGVQRRYKACCARRGLVRIAPEFNLIECPQEEEVPTASTSTEVEAVEMPELFPTEMELMHTETELMYTETELLCTETPQTKQNKTKANKTEINLPHTPSQNGGGNEKMTLERLKDYFAPPDYALDKKTHNYDGLLERLYAIGVCCRVEVEAILRLSRYGEIGHPVWGIIVHGKWAGEKKPITAPAKYIIKVLLNFQKSTNS
ncbi:DUF4373 domain-containing protein [Bacteroides ihuae]|uniref:DUF4373 domain-containing protein n=1 Tax=Bacteroides ihuae TaxID=1852362 RepID=UPI0008D90125|nr:DUF4373 domain-containing protein [Bacteroides ihuae]